MKTLLFVFLTVVLFTGLNPVRLYPGQENITGITGDTGETVEKFDLFLVLDNSGSMKSNDPKFLTHAVVTDFLKEMDEQNRLGMVIFDEVAVLAHPLTRLADDNARDEFLKTLERVDYKGQWTNSPAAIERALYELKTNGRKDAEKIIIFLTDGIVDTGNKDRDNEKLSWLKEELARDSKNSGVRIFGIAFTDKADFSLIQTLALKTGGQYFRAFNAEDIQGVFSKIIEAIKKLKTGKPETSEETPAVSAGPGKQEPVSPAAPVKKEEPPLPLPVILGGLILVLLVIIILLTSRKKKKDPSITSVDTAMPQAELIDEQKVISSERIAINKNTVTIGRDPNTDITIPKETVSALHATIRYRQNAFYLEDQRSSNFTRLNNRKISPNQPVALKSGDRIAFDIYNFQFILPQMIPVGGTLLKNEKSKETEGTHLRKPEPPEQPTIPKPQPTVPKDKTKNKPGMCPNHPGRKATDLCTVCKRPFCAQCITQQGGKDVCISCAKK